MNAADTLTLSVGLLTALTGLWARQTTKTGRALRRTKNLLEDFEMHVREQNRALIAADLQPLPYKSKRLREYMDPEDDDEE